MKKMIFVTIALLMIACHTTFAQTQKVYTVGTTRDTAKSNTTKTQTLAIGTADVGVTLAYHLDQITDTITGHVSVWCSINGTTYFPYPSIDSVAISAATDVYKMWFINTKVNGNPIRSIQVRTRCPSNTTNATSKAKLNTELYTY